MLEVRVLYGTESGNAEMVADEIVDALLERGIAASSEDLANVDVTTLAPGQILLVSSTYNEGDLPASAEPFVETLAADQPSLAGLRFAAFGLGDSTYEFYNNGIERLRTVLLDRGAEQLGATGKHDASSGISPIEPAVAWALETAERLTLTVTA